MGGAPALGARGAPARENEPAQTVEVSLQGSLDGQPQVKGPVDLWGASSETLVSHLWEILSVPGCPVPSDACIAQLS